ncbi:MAG TPA: protein translocase SEC61 complex subunit gamma [Nitrososphaeraceae archaeon]|nr:protein translocase SEC61 complex subunit gamma [Nitrososphaeraceae archaeon]
MKRLPIIGAVQRKVIEILQTLKLAKKTSKEDYTTHLRLVLISIGAVGGVGFAIKLISEFVTNPRLIAR